MIPQAIAKSLKASAEHSDRRKSDPYRSSMSMLTFYINRAGHNLPATQKKRLEQAKDALRELFGRAPARKAAPNKATTGKAASNEAASKTTATRKTTAKRPAPKNAASKKTAGKRTSRKAS